MSTKVTLKSRLRVDGQPGFHLYDDVLTEMAYELAEEGGSTPAPPVYLTLEGVEVELQTLPSGGAAVTLTIPRNIARELGLVPSVPDGQVKFPHPWPPQIPPGRTTRL